MPFANFLEFGAGICEVAGIVFPHLQPDAGGSLAFHLRWQDVVIDFFHEAQHPDVALMSVNFGAFPDDLELDVLRALTEANFGMSGPDGPVFSTYPGSREVILQKTLRFSHVDSISMIQLLDRAAQIARHWRSDPTFASLESGSASNAPPESFIRA